MRGRNRRKAMSVRVVVEHGVDAPDGIAAVPDVVEGREAWRRRTLWEDSEASGVGVTGEYRGVDSVDGEVFGVTCHRAGEVAEAPEGVAQRAGDGVDGGDHLADADDAATRGGAPGG